MRARTAVVVGAGLAGLAAAGALARAGWRVTLLERDDRLRAAPTGLVLWSNGLRALRALHPEGGWDGIMAALPDAGVRRPDGQWLARPRHRPDAPPTAAAVHRQELHDALVAALGDVDVRTGVVVRGLRCEDGARPLVDDGRLGFEADLVVAADGIDSTLRGRFVPAAVAVGSGFAAWQAVVPGFRLSQASNGARWHGETLGAGYRFVAVPLGERCAVPGGVYWVATVAGASRPEPPETQLTLLRRWFGNWHPSVGELLERTRPEDLVQREVRELRPLPRAFGFPCGSGGVVLVGDAAHAMPHHLGQGACLSFEDAVTLRSAVAAAVPGPALHAAVRAYSRERRPRTVAVVRQTRRMSVVLQARGRLALRARNAAFGALAPRLLGRASAPAWQPPD